MVVVVVVVALIKVVGGGARGVEAVVVAVVVVVVVVGRVNPRLMYSQNRLNMRIPYFLLRSAYSTCRAAGRGGGSG